MDEAADSLFRFLPWSFKLPVTVLAGGVDEMSTSLTSGRPGPTSSVVFFLVAGLRAGAVFLMVPSPSDPVKQDKTKNNRYLAVLTFCFACCCCLFEVFFVAYV